MPFHQVSERWQPEYTVEPGKTVRFCDYFCDETSTEINKAKLDIYQANSLIFNLLSLIIRHRILYLINDISSQKVI